MRRLIPFVVFAAACGTPGPEVRPAEGDFAFLQVNIKT
jgi:hypothetical protein